MGEVGVRRRVVQTVPCEGRDRNLQEHRTFQEAQAVLFLRSDVSQGVVRGETQVGLGQITGGFLHPRKEFSLKRCKQWSDMVRSEYQAARSWIADNSVFERTRPGLGNQSRARAE